MNKDLGKKKISSRLMSLFLKQLSLLLNSGISLNDSLIIIKNQKMDRKIDTALDLIVDGLNKGLSPYESFYIARDYFSPMVLAFINSGNQTGKLANVLSDLADFLNEDSKNKSIIKQAMTYPILLLFVTVFVLIIILEFVMPSFIEIFNKTEQSLPLATRILINLSNFIAYNYIFILLILAIIILFILFLRTDYKKKVMIDKVIFDIKNLSGFSSLSMEYQVTNLYRILRKGDIGQIESFEIIKNSFTNTYLREIFISMIDDLNKGNDLSKCFRNTGIFSPLFLSMIDIGEKTGKLDYSLDKVCEYYSELYIYKLKRMTSLLEPVMILIMSVIVAFVVFAVALPMFDSVNIGV